MNTKLINLSAEPDNKLYSWLPRNLKCEKIIFFPDACPGKSPLPTGTTILTYQNDWRKYAISDVGCGMTFVQSDLNLSDFQNLEWDNVYYLLKENKGKLGDIGSGNHFVTAYCSLADERLYFVIHTGSRLEGKVVEQHLDNPVKFDKEFESTCEWAKENRMTVVRIINKIFGKTSIIIDRPHNTFEKNNDGSVIIRKGTVCVRPDETTIIPSSMDGDMVLVKATAKISDYLNSLSHGTGRTTSRSQSKIFAENYDYNLLRRRIYIPKMISDSSIRTEAPFCYRKLDDCLHLLGDIVLEVERFTPIAYIGQI